MNFFKAAIMSAPLLEAPTTLWAALIRHLREQGAGTRESGAFLLGHKTESGRVMTKVLPYQNLQADALHNDHVSLTAGSFAKLWDFCRREGLSVVGDVHTHRFGASQSPSDQENPMVALPGHIAFIVPRFAQGNIGLHDLGMYVYKGNHQWTTFSGAAVPRLVRLTDAGGSK